MLRTLKAIESGDSDRRQAQKEIRSLRRRT